MKNFFTIKKLLVSIIPLILLLLGFLINEDLSTGGSKLDFYQTFPVVENFSNFIFYDMDKHTRHFPLHYFLLSLPLNIFDNIFVTRVFYLLFVSFTPILIYLNLSKLYPKNGFYNYLISFSVVFIPYFRASAIWPNAHLTALIFLLISNYYFLVYQEKKDVLMIFLNIIFLTFATYSIQSYSIFFLYYLSEYFKKNKFIEFFYILFLCFILSLPGFYLVLKTPLGGKLDFTGNISYTILTNFSIVFFFILFFLSNKKTLQNLTKFIKDLKIVELIILSSIFIFLFINYENPTPGLGGGFFYKVSFFLLDNNVIFFIVSFCSLFSMFFIFKKNKKLFFLIILVNLTSTAYYTSQKYFEPLLLIVILTMLKNFLTFNTITSRQAIIKFYGLICSYYILAIINNYLNFSSNLSIS